MKLKINKACDLSSISVFPPRARRTNNVTQNAPETSVFNNSQASRLRSQPSQQSFSQNASSQLGVFSQLSQNSMDDIVTNEQRFTSQDRDNSAKRLSQEKDNPAKRMSCLAPACYSREEGQMAISRSSTNLLRKWSAASVPEQRLQISEELEHRISMMENSLNRCGMIIDSVQSDMIQVNNGTKELSLEMGGIKQKMIVQENSLQQLTKGQEDIKDSLHECLRSISELPTMSLYQEKLEEILLVTTSLTKQLEASVAKLNDELCKTFTRDMQAMVGSLKTTQQKSPVPTAILPPKAQSVYHGVNNGASSSRMTQPLKSQPVSHEVSRQPTLIAKVEMGSWNTVKAEKATFTDRRFIKEQKKKFPKSEQGKEWRVIIDSDEDVNGGFTSLFEEQETGNYLMGEAIEETERILRRARRRKRKSCNTIIIS